MDLMDLKVQLDRIEQATLLQVKDMLTVQDACLYTGMGIHTIHRLTSLRRIPVYKPNGRNGKTYYAKQDLLKYMQSARINSEEETLQNIKAL